MVVFWFSVVCFILNCYDILIIILYSEIIWVILYCYIVIIGIVNDDLILISTSFFIMALAGLEFCIGFILVIFFRNFKKNFTLYDTEKNKTKSLNWV